MDDAIQTWPGCNTELVEHTKKPECNACGADDYEGELRECPRCGSTKCSICDMGDDVECAACDDDA